MKPSIYLSIYHSKQLPLNLTQKKTNGKHGSGGGRAGSGGAGGEAGGAGGAAGCDAACASAAWRTSSGVGLKVICASLATSRVKRSVAPKSSVALAPVVSTQEVSE